MKRVKDGTLYDTDQAEQVARHIIRPLNRHDWWKRFEDQTLYRAPDGTYLLEHRVGEAPGRDIVWSKENIVVERQLHFLTPEQALDWCEDRGIDGEIVASEFPDRVSRQEPTDDS